MSWKKFFQKPDEDNVRIKILKYFGYFLIFIIILKLFSLQILQHSFYIALASGQHEIYKKLFPERGRILIPYELDFLGDSKKEYYPLAANKEYYLIYAQPRDIENPEEVAKQLSGVLEISEQEIFDIINKPNDPYESVKRKVSKEFKEKIEKMKLPGIFISPETYRYYPENNISSHVVGFLTNEKVGNYGLEGYFNDILSGRVGMVHSEKDLLGRIISKKDFEEAMDGADIVLTLDKNIQFQACNALNRKATDMEADSGTVVIMNPKNGKILAMCSYPDFDPNNYSQVESYGVYNNTAIFTAYEPGSIFKVITMATGLDLEKITPETSYEDKGEVVYGEYTIKNADLQAHGKQTMTEVLEKSLNTGTIFVIDQIGKKAFKRYLDNFGFGQKIGIKLDTEVAGDISSLDQRAEVNLATASFGQGITVTPIQMIQAVGAIANNGKMMKPYLVEKIIYSNGETIEYASQEKGQIISGRAANLLAGMMVRVIESGHGGQAGVNGYYLAGKTGTAQIAKTDSAGYSQRTNHSFIGFGPVDNPYFVMIVKLEDPKKGSFSSTTAAPIFGELAKYLLDYFYIPPDY